MVSNDFVGPKMLNFIDDLQANGFCLCECKNVTTLCLGEKEYVLIRFISANAAFYRKTEKFCFVLTSGKGGRSRYCSAILLKSSSLKHDEIFVGDRQDEPNFNKDLAVHRAVNDFKMFSCLENAYSEKKNNSGKQYFSSGRKSSEKQVVKTRKEVLDALTLVFGELYDPCPVAPVKDAMMHPWAAMNFVNPPFKHMGAFMLRAAELAVSSARSKTILIGPANTYTNAFHALIKTQTLHAVAMIRPGRFFDGYRNLCPFPIFLLFVGPARTEVARIPLFFVELFLNQKRVLPSTTAMSLAEVKSAIGW